MGDQWKDNAPICAGCGAPIRPDWIIDDILCPTCLDKLHVNGPSWVEAEGMEATKP